jgi:DNA-directed RNA polymerase specialized sigma24 family protein
VQNEDVLRLEAAMERLPEQYREVIGLCRIVGLSREQAGERMGGRAPGAVRSLLSRALVALSHELDRGRTRDGDTIG